MNDELDELFAKAYNKQYEGELAEAIEIYQLILAKNSQHVDSLHFLGLTYAQLGYINETILYLNQAQQLAPDDPTILNNLANAYKKTQQYELAKHYYLKALALKPEYAQAHSNLASVYDLQNDYKAALTHYKNAVHASPDFAAAHFNLGVLLLKNNELEAALKQFNNVLSLIPEHVEAQFYKGVLYLENNSLAEAEQAFHRVISLDNNHVEALTNLGVIALKMDQNQLAVDYFSKALAIDNDHCDARNNLAATFMHHDRFENALMHYDELLKREPKNIEYLYNSGVAQMALGHLKEAIGLFDRVLMQQPKHAPALTNLAAVYLKMDQKSLAKEYLEKAYAINPDDHITKHLLNAIAGNQEAQTTPDYAQNLFNNYALYYDQHMQGELKYTVPEHIARMLQQLPLNQFTNTVDLGCGTGLTGMVLRPKTKKLIGVDIATKMLAQAKAKGIYDELVQDELLHFLNKNPTSFDLVVAADVLPYFSDLKELFKAIHNHLANGGYFVCSTEISKQPPWTLELSARFSHHPDYLQHLFDELGFELIQQEKVPARMQNQMPLNVLLSVVQKRV